jgi:hypothetical protein
MAKGIPLKIEDLIFGNINQRFLTLKILFRAIHPTRGQSFLSIMAEIP